MTLSVRVVPRSGRTTISGVRGGALLVRVTAPAIEGAANEALVKLLADTFRVGRRAVRLVSGERARLKRVQITGPSVGQAAAALRAVLTRDTPPADAA